MGKRVLVTGAAGQVGHRLVERLQDKQYDVRALVLPDDPNRDRLDDYDIELVEGDLLDESVAEDVVDGVDAIVHAANLVGPLPDMSQYNFFHNNVQSTYNVAYAASQHAESIERLVYISSSAVYPNDSHELAPAYNPIDEAHPLRPVGTYAASKLSSERTIESLARKTELRYSIVRPSGVLSGTAPLERCTVDFMATILEIGGRHPEGTIYPPNGRDLAQELRDAAPDMDRPCAITDKEGRPWLDQPVHVQDLVHGIICALEHPAAVGDVFNIAAPRREAAPQVAALYEEITGKPVFEWEVPVRWVFDLDVAKAKGMIGYRPEWDFQRMLSEAWEQQTEINEENG